MTVAKSPVIHLDMFIAGLCGALSAVSWHIMFSDRCAVAGASLGLAHICMLAFLLPGSLVVSPSCFESQQMSCAAIVSYAHAQVA